MISEDLLQQAAAEFSDAMVASVEDRPHDFSPGFERRMQPLLRRAAYPVRYRLLRQCANVFLALLIGLGALLALSPSARAIVRTWFREETGWFRDIVNDNVQYLPNESTSPNVQYDYFLPEVLDGYTLLHTSEDVSGKMYVYVNDNGQVLHFEYIRHIQGTSLVIFDPEDYIHHTNTVGKSTADIYLAPDSSENSIIVWECPETQVLLFIRARASEDELIALAESVKKNIKISE